MNCVICGQDGATQFYCADKDADISESQWYHILCLAKEQIQGSLQTLKWTRPKALGYLAGIIDGEGHVRKNNGQTCIVNNDIGVIAAAKSAAEHIGIPTSVTISTHKDGYSPTFRLNFLGGKATRRKLFRLPLGSGAKRTVLRLYG